MKSASMDMCEGPLFGKIIKYTIPIILTGILQLLFNAADLVIVGRFCGSDSVAAVGATGSLINLIVNLFIGLSVGVGVRTAYGIGANDPDDVHKTIHTAIPAAFISGVFLTVVGIFFSSYSLELLGTPKDIAPLSTLYMKIYFCGITSSMLYNFGSAILRAAGDTKRPLIYLSIAGVANVCMNLIFVYFFNMDVDGVALATAISQTISAVLVIVSLVKRDDACKLEFRKMRIYKRSLFKIMQVGIPAGIQSSLFAVSNVIIQSSVNSFGSVVVSGNAAASNIEGFTFISMNALHQTALNFIGQNYGAKKYDRIGKVLGICLGLVAFIGLTMGSLGYIFGRDLLSIYIKDSQEAIEYGMIRLRYICLLYAFCGIQDVMTGAIRGMGASLVPMIVSVLGICGFRILWVYTVFAIPKYHNLQSLFVSYPISWILIFCVLLGIFFIILNRRKKKGSDLV